MLKSKSFTLEKPKQSEGWTKIQEWDRRWNKVLSIIFGVLSFMLLFAIVLANTMSTAAVLPPTAAPDRTTTSIETTTDFPSTTETTEFSTTDIVNTTIEDTTLDASTEGLGIVSAEMQHPPPFDGTIMIWEFCFIRFCNVTCTNGRIKQLSSIMDTLRRLSHCHQMNLEINRCTFPKRRIQRNWLETSANIKVLKITNSQVNSIDDRAFTSNCFKHLHTLVILNLDITKFYSTGTFKGLGNLQRLEMINLPLRYFNSEVFHPLANNLNTLVFERMNNELFPIQNITGNSSRNLANLKFLSLKYNRLESVNESSFEGLQNIVEIQLSHSNIAGVGRRSFDNLRSLKRLSMNGNNIEGLPKKIFDEILRNNEALIDVTDNPFLCDCGVKQLQKYLGDPITRYKFVMPLTCIMPLQCWEDFVKDCNICGQRSRPTSPTITTQVAPHSPSDNDTSFPSSEKPPKGKPDHYDDVACFNKAAFITLLVMSLLFSASVGAVCLFCALRHCPAFIKRAKFSFASNKPTTIEPVVYASTVSATPRSSTSKPPFLRSLSDTSIGSGRSYVSAINTPHFRTISWRMDKSNYMFENSIYLEDSVLDRPPPLPPHPRRNSSLTTNATSTRNYSANENIYELYE
ncbi:uncharacterized protein LOC129786445 [Lutzomyia longipalpis]|nr:uncharacterized protein LOC129786445 [Lutzomyia longipalpis]